MILRKGSVAEASSQITREQFQTLKFFAEIARDTAGRPLIAAHVLTVLSVPRLDGSGTAVVSVRGMTAEGMQLRPQVRLAAGRWFVAGHAEERRLTLERPHLVSHRSSARKSARIASATLGEC